MKIASHIGTTARQMQNTKITKVTRILNPLCVLCVLCGSLIGPLGGTAFAQQPSAAQRSLQIRQAQMPSDGEVHVLPVQGNVYMLVGAGGNIAVQIGDEGVPVVATCLAAMSHTVLPAIKKLSPRPIRYIVNTHLHPDHTGGNEVIGKAGSTTAGGATSILSHENALSRMSAPLGKPGAAAPALWPTDTFFPEEKDFFFNDEAVMLYHDAAAHTDGDTIVFLRRSDVVVAGDIFITTGYPVIDTQSGGSVQGVIAGLNRILDLTVPKHEQEGGTYVIPATATSVTSRKFSMRDMVVIIKERIEDMVKRGLTVEQVKAAKPAGLRPPLRRRLRAMDDAMFIETVSATSAKRAEPEAARRIQACTCVDACTKGKK